jgi:hypothetical protein
LIEKLHEHTQPAFAPIHHHNAKIYAQREGISVNQLAATALAEKLAALATEDYITQRGQRASAEKFAAALALVPDVPPIAGDELPL